MACGLGVVRVERKRAVVAAAGAAQIVGLAGVAAEDEDVATGVG